MTFRSCSKCNESQSTIGMLDFVYFILKLLIIFLGADLCQKCKDESEKALNSQNHNKGIKNKYHYLL
jgi:hypothetical protein